MDSIKLNSFLGIDFGSTPEIAKEKLLSRQGCTFDEENSSDKAYFFNGLNFAGRQTEFVMLLFVNGKFCKSAVFIKPKLEAFAIQIYKEIQSELNSKYFKAQDDFEIYEEPYYENDGYTETGISVGKITFASYWTFQDANGGLEDTIGLKINEDLDIILNYEDGDLANEMVNKSNDENSLDY